jgi:hypothetical protein
MYHIYYHFIFIFAGSHLFLRNRRPHFKGFSLDNQARSPHHEAIKMKREDIMKLPEYVTVKEVKRVCKALGLRDWTTLKKPEVKAEEAELILKEVRPKGMKIPVEDFQAGLEVELEHGTVTGCQRDQQPPPTGKTVGPSEGNDGLLLAAGFAEIEAGSVQGRQSQNMTGRPYYRRARANRPC